MNESTGAPGTFPENAPFLPEKCCNYKCLVYTFISLKCIGTTKKHGRKKPNLTSFYTKLKNWVGQNHWQPQLNVWWHTLWRK